MSARNGYAEIAAHYRQQIRDGELSPGDALPTIREAAATWGVTTATVNRAYRMLATETLVESRGTRGTVVAKQEHVATTGAQRAEMLTRTGRNYAPGETSTNHTAERARVTDPVVCHHLEIEEGDEVVIRRRVFRQDGTPTVYATSWIHIRALEDVPEVMTQGQLKPWWQITYTERTGREVTRSPERRTARIATPEELRALEIKAPRSVAVAVLVLNTTHHDEHGPIEYWEDVHTPAVDQVG